MLAESRGGWEEYRRSLRCYLALLGRVLFSSHEHRAGASDYFREILRTLSSGIAPFISTLDIVYQLDASTVFNLRAAIAASGLIEPVESCPVLRREPGEQRQ